MKSPSLDDSSDGFAVEPSVPRPKKTSTDWMICFGVVKFDLEIGQVLEYTFPQTKLPEDLVTNICFLSFPDSNSNIMGDLVFWFRTKDPGTEGGYIYGYVFFRQEKDATISRGYLQKSIVLLTKQPYVGLFKRVVGVMGPLFFQVGNPVFESAYQNILYWPEPEGGRTLALPVLGCILNFHVPFTRQAPHIIDPSFRVGASNSDVLVSNLHSVNLYGMYRRLKQQLWLLWELVLTGEPILIIAPTPPMSSDTVLALVSLISPLSYGGDFRPYFTIHDSDYKNFAGPMPPKNIILGVTNPFFMKALEQWPHHLTIGTPLPKKKAESKAKGGSIKAEFKQEVKTKYKPCITADKDLIKTLADRKSFEPSIVRSNNELLRKCFMRLTETFLIPCERYFSSLMPLAKSITAFQPAPKVKPFNEENFFKLIRASGKIILSSKAKELELYKKFILTPTFHNWFQSRMKEAQTRLNELYRRALIECDFATVLPNKSEIQIVDLYLTIKDQLRQEKSAALEQALREVTSYLPADLQSSLQMNTINDDQVRARYSARLSNSTSMPSLQLTPESSPPSTLHKSTSFMQQLSSMLNFSSAPSSPTESKGALLPSTPPNELTTRTRSYSSNSSPTSLSSSFTRTLTASASYMMQAFSATPSPPSSPKLRAMDSPSGPPQLLPLGSSAPLSGTTPPRPTFYSANTTTPSPVRLHSLLASEMLKESSGSNASSNGDDNKDEVSDEENGEAQDDASDDSDYDPRDEFGGLDLSLAADNSLLDGELNSLDDAMKFVDAFDGRLKEREKAVNGSL